MKVIQHGKYWKEELQKAVKDKFVQCPECGEKFKVIEDYNPPFAQCICGCGFMYDRKDLIEDVK